jgi:hypothetical protein
MALIYTGDGAALAGVPARDLSDKEIEERKLNEAELIASGLYRRTGETTKPPPPPRIAPKQFAPESKEN